MDRSKLFATFPVQRIVLIVCILGFIGIVLGCMSPTVVEKTTVIHDEPQVKIEDVYLQSGSAEVRANEELDIFYPVPLASTPNLTIEQYRVMRSSDNEIYYQIVEQHPTHFRIRNTAHEACEIHWKARGLRADTHQPPIIAVPPTGVPPVTLPAPSLAPTANLPAEPVPIDDNK